MEREGPNLSQQKWGGMFRGEREKKRDVFLLFLYLFDPEPVLCHMAREFLLQDLLAARPTLTCRLPPQPWISILPKTVLKDAGGDVQTGCCCHK